MDICHISPLGVSSDISHSRIKEAMDTNLLEVAGSSETAHTLATFNHLDSTRTTIPRLLAYCCLNATRERHQGFTQTTTKGDDYNYHKAKLQLSPRETHRQTLLCLLVYTAISFLRTLYSYFRVFLCNINRLGPVLNVPEASLHVRSGQNKHFFRCTLNFPIGNFPGEHPVSSWQNTCFVLNELR